MFSFSPLLRRWTTYRPVYIHINTTKVRFFVIYQTATETGTNKPQELSGDISERTVKEITQARVKKYLVNKAT